MKRRVLIVLLLLVAGAIVNVAVAWGGLHQIRSDPRWWWWDYLTLSYECHGDPRAITTTFSCGIPCRVVAGTTAPGQHNNPSWWILWPGFAINTVFYALVLWLLFAAPLALRRRRRIKRGLCPKCAYDLRDRPSDSSVCPECGATVNRIAR